MYSLRPDLLVPILFVSVTSAPGALEVVENPGDNVAAGSVAEAMVSSPIAGVTTATAGFSQGGFWGKFTAPGGGDVYFFRADTSSPPDVSTAIASSQVGFWADTTGIGGSEQYNNGAEQGEDNWVYITSNTGAKAWAQIDIDRESFSPLRYVHDPDAPVAPISFEAALAAVNPPASSPRDIQFRSVDFRTGVVELKNYGSESIDLDGWRFCSHDEDQVRRYSSSSGLNGISIAAGESLFIHFNNDASGSGTINRSAIGGAFATPLDNGAYGLQIYFAPVSFSNGNTIADHLQWSRGGEDDGNADDRSDEAQSGGVWGDQSNWIVTTDRTEQLILTDRNGGELHGPDDYLRLPDFLGSVSADYNRPSGDFTIAFDSVNNLVIDVERSTTLSEDSWTNVLSTSSDRAFLTGEFADRAFFRIAPQVP